jgi:uncharacterized protein (DUF2336 family)
MPAAEVAFLPELEQALRHVPLDRHAEMVRRMTDFFLAGAGRFNADHVNLFDRVLGRLMVAIDDKALGELARRIASIRNAPPGVIRRLAGSAVIAIAAPVLTRSLQLADHDLVAIIQTQSQAHLLAISGRAQVSEAVGDALIECGDRDVARNLALNRGARFSPAGLGALVERAATDPVLAEKLAQRHDVAPPQLSGLLRASTAEVREHLMAVACHDDESAVATALASVPPEMREAAEEEEAWRTVRVMQRRGELGGEQILRFARGGRAKHTFAALALICDVSIDVVRRLMQGDQPEAALILCQAAGVGWETACGIVEAVDGKPATPLAQATAELHRLSPATAARIVGFFDAAAAGPERAAA